MRLRLPAYPKQWYKQSSTHVSKSSFSHNLSSTTQTILGCEGIMTLANDTYSQLIWYLDANGASYRLIDHEPEGRTDIVSPMRGNALAQAAKCIILMVKLGKKVTKYVLAVIPGDARVDLEAVKTLMGGTYILFALQEIAGRPAGRVAGTVVPFR